MIIIIILFFTIVAVDDVMNNLVILVVVYWPLNFSAMLHGIAISGSQIIEKKNKKEKKTHLGERSGGSAGLFFSFLNPLISLEEEGTYNDQAAMCVNLSRLPSLPTTVTITNVALHVHDSSYLSVVSMTPEPVS